jgi:hypothetical protein
MAHIYDGVKQRQRIRAKFSSIFDLQQLKCNSFLHNEGIGRLGSET